MNEIYRSIGTTKQNIHQRLDHELFLQEEKEQLLVLMRQIRDDHPQLGARKMYEMLNPLLLGRDRFMVFYNASGLKLKAVKNYRKTTNSNGVIRFPNLISEMELTGTNQVWVSDITYYELNGKFCYLVFIMDVFSRKIKGYHASESLRTTATTIPALKMALKHLSAEHKLILHSDGGGQYYCKAFLALTKDRLKNSMCESVYENAHAERINGIIKNEYLIHYGPDNFGELKKMLNKAVNMYNQNRPHQALGMLTPDQFEKLHSYPQQTDLFTKEKSSKKENLQPSAAYGSSNSDNKCIVKQTE